MFGEISPTATSTPILICTTINVNTEDGTKKKTTKSDQFHVNRKNHETLHQKWFVSEQTKGNTTLNSTPKPIMWPHLNSRVNNSNCQKKSKEKNKGKNKSKTKTKTKQKNSKQLYRR